MSQNCNSNLSGDVSVSIPTDKGSMPNLLTLPDVPLLCILKYVPLQSLYDLPLVSSRFVPLCDLVLQQNFKRNRRLLLYLGDLERIRKFKCSFRIGIPFANYLVDANGKDRFPDPEFHRLHYVTLNGETVLQLVTLMPTVSHLEVVISQVNYYLIHMLTSLLAHWAYTLKVLKLGCVDFKHDDAQYLLELIDKMNRWLYALEHLTLDIDGDLLKALRMQHQDQPRGFNQLREADPEVDLPILGRLSEFFLQTKDKGYFLGLLVRDTLERQAGQQLTEIGLGLPFSWANYREMMENHPLADRFTLLNTRYELPPFALTSFPNLQGYTTHWHLSEPLNSCTSKLVSLQNLQYLELRRLSHNNDENVAVDPFAPLPLPSVEILRIHFNNSPFSPNDHTVLQDAHWASLFPSVQIVNLIHMGDFCAKCYPKEDGNCCDKPPGLEQSAERTACLEQLLAPLTVLPSLRKIFYQRNDDLRNIAEFTGKGEFVKIHAYIY